MLIKKILIYVKILFAIKQGIDKLFIRDFCGDLIKGFCPSYSIPVYA